MRMLFWLARAWVSFQFLEGARQVQSMGYSKKTVMKTYKGLRSFLLPLLYLPTPRPEGSAEKTASVVFGVHNQVVVRLHCPLAH